jgi:hypothetical protein
MRIHSAPARLLPYIPIQNTLREGAKIWPELSSLRSRSHGWTTARRLVIDSGNKTSGNSRLKTKGAWHEVHQEFWDLTWILCFALLCFGRRTLQKPETMNNSEEMHQFECFAVNWDHEEFSSISVHCCWRWRSVDPLTESLWPTVLHVEPAHSTLH